MESFLDFYNRVNEASLGRLVQHFQKGDVIAILSAERDERSKSENKKLTVELRRYVIGAGFGYNRAVGGYTETRADNTQVDIDGEASTIAYTTPDRESELKKLAIALGKRYQQECVLFVYADGKAVWIYTTAVKDHPLYSEVPLGEFHPKQIGKYYSKIGKKHFSFVVKEEEITQWSECDITPTTVTMRIMDEMCQNLKTSKSVEEFEECLNGCGFPSTCKEITAKTRDGKNLTDEQKKFLSGRKEVE